MRITSISASLPNARPELPTPGAVVPGPVPRAGRDADGTGMGRERSYSAGKSGLEGDGGGERDNAGCAGVEEGGIEDQGGGEPCVTGEQIVEAGGGEKWGALAPGGACSRQVLAAIPAAGERGSRFRQGQAGQWRAHHLVCQVGVGTLKVPKVVSIEGESVAKIGEAAKQEL